MRVKAKAKGSYGGLRTVGEIFTLEEKETADGVTVTAEEQFSPRWMVKVDGSGNEITDNAKTTKADKAGAKTPATPKPKAATKPVEPPKEPETGEGEGEGDDGTEDAGDGAEDAGDGTDPDAGAGEDGDAADEPKETSRRRRRRG